MAALFISYRRDDAQGEAGRLFDDFAAAGAAHRVFMDVDGLAPGCDFRKALEENVGACHALLAVIGHGWLEARGEAGQRRLDDPGDFVRLEIGAALRRGIPVIPVLVHGARMPVAEALPADLRDLAYRNAVELTHARWRSDFELLLQALRPMLGPDAGAEPAAPPAPAATPAAEQAPPSSAAPPAATPTPVRTAASPPRSRRLALVAGGVAALVLLGGAAAVALRPRGVAVPDPATPESAGAAWLALVQGGRFGEAYAAAAPELRGRVTEQQFTANHQRQIASGHGAGPQAHVTARTVTRREARGDDVALVFRTTSSDAPPAVDTLVLRRQADRTWRVLLHRAGD